MLKFFIKVVCLSIFVIHTTNAQDATKTHTVKKGETIYQIGRIYNVSPKTLLQLNPNASGIIYVNDIIILSNSNTRNANESGQYIVKRGETKYGLSRKFGVTISTLENENPHIKNGLQAGHILNVSGIKNRSTASTSNIASESIDIETMPYLVKKGETLWAISKAYNTTVSQLKSSNRDVIDNVLRAGSTIRVPIKADNKITNTYLVQKGDTKYGLSKRYNTTISELERLNPQIKQQLYVSSTIKIPQSNASNIIAENSTNTDDAEDSENEINEIKTVSQKNTSQINDTVIENVSAKLDKPIASLAKVSELYTSVDKTEQNDILMFIPFTEEQFDHYTRNPSEFVTLDNKSLKDNIELYRGAKMAIDSIKSLGLQSKVKISALENPNVENAISDAINVDPMQKYDGVILPFYINESEQIARSLSKDNIPVITTYAEQKQSNLLNLFEALPSPKLQRLAMLDHLLSKNANIIVVADREREESKKFIEEKVPNSKFLKLRRNGFFNDNDLISLLDKNKKNYVILETDKPSVVISSTNLLLKELSSHQIQIAILEQSLIPNINRVSPRRLRILNMLYPGFSKNELKDAPSKFLTHYRRDYNSEATLNVLIGFDMIYDTMLRLNQAENFAETAKNKKSEYMYLNFNYKQNALGRFGNNNLTILQYNTNDDNGQDD